MSTKLSETLRPLIRKVDNAHAAVERAAKKLTEAEQVLEDARAELQAAVRGEAVSADEAEAEAV